MATDTSQAQIDQRNAAFWDELCGTSLAQSLGITEGTPKNLELFDRAYLDLYPYLSGYLPLPPAGERPELLEIGLGFGTVGGVLVGRGFRYRGLDISPGPVTMMQHRISELGAEDCEAHQGSALAIPHPDASFDHVVSIGCLHHTGDLPLAVSEVERVPRPGGRATVMVYNRHSLRNLGVSARLRFDRLRGAKPDEHAARTQFETNTEGTAAPIVGYVSKPKARELFGGFREVEIDVQNFQALPIPRSWLLPTAGRVAGLDLYITATK